MSTLTDKAREEAERVEGDEHDDDEQTNPPAPDGGDDDDESGDAPELGSEAFEEGLELEQQRHTEAVAELFGPAFADLEACEHCAGVGFRPAATPRTNPRFKQCDTCNGFGVVLTGSRADGHETANCPRCGGRGYLERQPQQPQQPQQPAVEGDESGEWGVPSWMGDPNLTAG